VEVRLTGAGVQDHAGRVRFGVALLRVRAQPFEEGSQHGESPERLRALLYALSIAEERERRRIAAGLHDDLGQLLAIAKLKLGQLGAAACAPERRALAEDLRSLIDQAACAARSTTFELSSPVLEQLGLEAAIQSCGERMEQMYGFRFSFESDGAPIDLPREALVVLLRVVRELLFNVHKHARATAVKVAVRRVRGMFTLCAADDGVGFDPGDRHPRFTSHGGFGLFSAEAQVHAIGGCFAIDSAPGAGTRVTVSVAVP
jgi:signal transduction histidine kinase